MRILCSLILALSLLSCGGPSAQSDKKPEPTTIRKAPQSGSLAWSFVLTIYQFFAELFGDLIFSSYLCTIKTLLNLKIMV